jgi:hypothetical protein
MDLLAEHHIYQQRTQNKSPLTATKKDAVSTDIITRWTK